MKAAGYDYYRVDKEYGLLFPAVEANCRYLAPARYDDLLQVRTWLSQARGAHLRFESEIVRGGTPVARGFTRHACVAKDGFRITRIPAPLLAALSPYVGKAA
jgi:acyl-CoA thioester hydrolase